MIVKGNLINHLYFCNTFQILYCYIIFYFIKDGVADKKLDSRRRQLNVHKRAGRNSVKGI